MEKQHQKHAKLKRSEVGNFHRNEIAILGTTCADIQALALKISTQLTHLKIAYIDTEHKKEDAPPSVSLPFDFYHYKENAFKSLTKKISEDQQRYVLNEMDLVIANGNHHNANRQILVIDSRKDLTKKKDKVTNPVMILANDTSEDEFPAFLKDEFPDLPVFNLLEDDWLSALDDFCTSRSPLVNGLVLAGGKSTRMGEDKGSIKYHKGLKQREYLYDLINERTNEAYLSLSHQHDLENDVPENPFIKDAFIGLGVYGALLSAFQKDPNSAWLVSACDLPLVDENVIDLLMEHRNPSKVATAFYNPETDFPDPLFTIWEPRSYPILLNFLSRGYSCPRKVLINSDIELLKVDKPDFLKNVNTPEEYQEVIVGIEK